MKELDNLIIDLKSICENENDENFINNFEKKLIEISALHSPLIICKLLPFFKDDTDYDEAMFSIIHIIESFEDKIYVKELIKGLNDFYINSPRWASIIHIRIINSTQTLNTYINEIKKSSTENKKVFSILLNSISGKNKSLKDQVSELREECLK